MDHLHIISVTALHTHVFNLHKGDSYGHKACHKLTTTGAALSRAACSLSLSASHSLSSAAANGAEKFDN